MAILYCSPWDPAPWLEALADELPEVEVRVWPEVGRPEEIRYALVWNPPPELWRLPALEAVCVLGAGTDAVLSAPELPASVAVVRTVDEVMARRMAEYVLAAVLRHQRRFADYAVQQASRQWRRLPQKDADELRIGVLGLGELGATTATLLARLGYDVGGWSRRPKELPGVTVFDGPEGLSQLVRRSDVLVCLLPLTPETTSLLDAALFAELPTGAFLVHCARGAHLVEADLLAALDSGHLAGAQLDVFTTEPLPPEHPFWSHPKIFVTPHVAAYTHVPSAVRQAAESYRRLLAGEPLLRRVDRRAGY